MSRLVVHSATAPAKIVGKDGDVFTCLCGLSDNKPFCSGAHKTIKNESDDELVVYDEDGKLMKFEEGCDCDGDCECGDDHDHKEEGSGCCGGGCCGEKDDESEQEGCCGGGCCQ